MCQRLIRIQCWLQYTKRENRREGGRFIKRRKTTFATNKVTRLYQSYMAHIGLFHFSSLFLSQSIFLLSLSKYSPHFFLISHWDILFCGRHQGVPFSWRCLVGIFSWRCCEASFSHESQHESFSLAHQSVLFPWRCCDGPQY